MERSKHVTSLGMVTLLDDVALQHHRLLRQYQEAESASLRHFDQVEDVRRKVAATLDQASQTKGESCKLLRFRKRWKNVQSKGKIMR